LNIYTTLDPRLQKIALQAVSGASPQGALVALNPQTGAVLALMGGTSFRESQFNRATQAKRQPGSAFKPILYAAALENGFTPATLLKDEKKVYSDGRGGKWQPKNFDNVYRGTVTLREALTHSLNSASLDLIHSLGSKTVVEFAHKLGVQSPLANDLSLALGTSEVTLLELTAAYAAFDNGGFTVDPRLISSITDSTGEALQIYPPNRNSTLDPALASLMTSLLQSPVREGTAKSLSALRWESISAGKTGTTDQGRDAWFIGYTPEIVVGVWVGNDKEKIKAVSGAKEALPIWAEFMKLIYVYSSPKNFPEDQRLVKVTIDPRSGMKAQLGCPKRLAEFFLTGTEPQRSCPLHPGGVKGLLRRLFSSD